jgi:hypothetical protein
MERKSLRQADLLPVFGSRRVSSTRRITAGWRSFSIFAVGVFLICFQRAGRLDLRMASAITEIFRQRAALCCMGGISGTRAISRKIWRRAMPRLGAGESGG